MRFLAVLACLASSSLFTQSTMGETPVFTQSSMLQIVDARGRLNVFAVARDASVWRFIESPEATWEIEQLGGRATGIPSVSSTGTGLMQAWIVGPDQTIWTSHQNPTQEGWTAWKRIESPPALEITVTTRPQRGTIVLVRDTQGILHASTQRTLDGAPERWERIGDTAPGRVVVFGGRSKKIEVVYIATDGGLMAAVQRHESGHFMNRRFDVRSVEGSLAAVELLHGTAVVLARLSSGELISLERTEAGWSRAQKLPISLDGALADPQILTLDGHNVIGIARSPSGSLWMNRMSNGRWNDWIDTKIGADLARNVGIRLDGRVLPADGKSLSAAARSLFESSGFSITIDKIEPYPVVEGDKVTVRYTLKNTGSESGTGVIDAYWDSAELDPLPPSFTPPIAPGQQFEGRFEMGQFVRPHAGLNHLRLKYHAGTQRTISLGNRDVTIEDTTQLAQEHQSVEVLAFADGWPRWPTDDQPVQPGPASCLDLSEDRQHACGLGICAAGNTPQTCPSDCPSAPEVRSYNSQNLCRKVAGPVMEPRSIAEVQAAIRAAAQAGTRIRVIGNEHTSNALLCTEGQVLSTALLQGAVPRSATFNAAAFLGGEVSYCTRFNCAASLDTPAQPVVENYQGAQTVRVGPGKNLFELAEFLDQRGLSLGFAIPGFRNPTVGGAIATGTHGSSTLHAAVISNRVRSLSIALPDGSVKEFSAQTTSDAMWKAVRANLGFLGVVVQARLAVEPSFNLRARTSWIEAKDLLSGEAPHSYVAGCDFGEMVWFPARGADSAPVLVICGTRTTDAGDEENTLLFPADSDDTSQAYPALSLMQDAACNGEQACQMENTRMEVLRYYRPPFTSSECWAGQARVGVNAPSELVSGGNQFLLGLAKFLTGGLFGAAANDVSTCNAEVVGKSYRIMSSALTPELTRPFERDWEIFIPRQNAQAALKMAKDHFQQNGICLPLIGVFIRFAPAEDGTLIAHTVNEGRFGNSGAGMFLEMPVFLPKGMTCSNQARYEKVYADLAEKLVAAPIFGRGHWAKNRRSLFQLQRRLGTYGYNMTQFREIVRQTDPTGMFANQFGVDMGLRWPQLSSPIPADTESLGCASDTLFTGPALPICMGNSRCAERHETCLAQCGNDPSCSCACDNAYCGCKRGNCGSSCRTRVCASP